jgi:hypothetical protein
VYVSLCPLSLLRERKRKKKRKEEGGKRGRREYVALQDEPGPVFSGIMEFFPSPFIMQRYTFWLTLQFWGLARGVSRRRCSDSPDTDAFCTFHKLRWLGKNHPLTYVD